MSIQILRAQPAEAADIAEMIGELLEEITAAIGEAVFSFDRIETERRAKRWLAERTYTVLLARESGSHGSVGFLAMYESRALYAAGTFGTIPELYVRSACRSREVGSGLIEEAVRFGASQRWTRLEVTTPPLPQFERALAF